MSFIAASLIAGGLGATGAALGGYLGRGQAPEQGYDIVDMPTYPWAEGNQQAASNYYGTGVESLAAGQLPPGMEQYYGQMQGGLQQDSRERFYGSAGRPGTLRDVMGMGAVGGLGPQAALSKGLQAEYDFMTEGRKIDEYIAGLKTNEFSKQSQLMPQGLANLPRGPESQIVNMMGGGGQSGLGGQIGDAFGSIADSYGQYTQRQQQPPEIGLDYGRNGFGIGAGADYQLGGGLPSVDPYSPMSSGNSNIYSLYGR